MEDKIKARIILTLVTIFFLILIGYFMVVDQEWTVKALIIGPFAFFGDFNFTSYNAFFVTLFIFGIFVLPFVINELCFLDSYPHEQPNDKIERGLSIEEAEEQIDRLAGFLKSRFGFISKIKNYFLLIGIVFIILGCCLTILPSIWLIDSKPIERTFETGELVGEKYLYVAEYYGIIRGQLLLVGILFLVLGIISIRWFLKKEEK